MEMNSSSLNNTESSSHSLTTQNPIPSWRSSIVAEWNARRAAENEQPRALFPLAMNPFGEEEILAMADVLLTGRLTLGSEVEKAEKKFAQCLGVRYAVMVNSGSSANLLAVSALSNKLRAMHCNPGDQVLVPAVCWSTSVFPLLQNSLCPIFVDADPRTFNVTLAELERKFTPRVKAVVAVHVLGNSIDMRQMMDFVTRHKLMLIEDTCESLGSFCSFGVENEQKMLGTFGDFGTFSFYFSHHITSGEGGMITCKTEEDYNLLRCLRAHGWTRHLTNRQVVEAAHPDVDSRFLFVNVGYNFRPLEVQGAMLSVQLDKLSYFNQCRRDNLARIQELLSRDNRFKSVMSLMEAATGVDPAWFGVGVILHRPYAHQRLEFLKYLEKNGIENRPIISGNFIRQPCIAAFCEQERPEDYPGAEAIHTRGFFIGIHQIALEQTVIEKLVNIMLAFPFSPQHVVLVTESCGMIGRQIYDLVLEQVSNEHTTETMNRSLTSSQLKTKDSEWIFLTREDGDLRRSEDVTNIFKRFQPTRVIHCVSYYASVEEMVSKPVEFWMDNVTANNNILEATFKFQTWCGPIKLVSILPTEIFQQTDQLLHSLTNPLYSSLQSRAQSFVYTELSLAQLTKWYRIQHGCHFITVLPQGIFGPCGDFNDNSPQLVNLLIAKFLYQKENNQSASVTLKNTCASKCQVLFIRDLAKVLIWALEHYDNDETLFVSGEKVPILQLAQLVCEQVKFLGGFTYNSNDHDHKEQDDVSSSSPPKSISYPFQMTPLPTAIQQTVEWYRDKYRKQSV